VADETAGNRRFRRLHGFPSPPQWPLRDPHARRYLRKSAKSAVQQFRGRRRAAPQWPRTKRRETADFADYADSPPCLSKTGSDCMSLSALIWEICGSAVPGAGSAHLVEALAGETAGKPQIAQISQMPFPARMLSTDPYACRNLRKSADQPLEDGGPAEGSPGSAHHATGLRCRHSTSNHVGFGPPQLPEPV
jgi:hypothetical protein